MARLRFSATARNDLLEAWLYVAEEDTDAADRILDHIDAEARHLLDQRKMGRERSELAAGLRSWPTSTPYILFYFEDDQGIVVARVLHHARDIPMIDAWPKH
ncbi:MAG TPA: type II toxin-antitoxin system RelE/ParE family toxin [Rhodocyclaceae bacterium]|nr:type II toxin-antitoxin system RelE/ParE family toxin [Rhodocyclaceae bacterium]